MTTDLENRLGASCEHFEAVVDDDEPDLQNVVSRARKRSHRRQLVGALLAVGVLIVAGVVLVGGVTDTAGPVRIGSAPTIPPAGNSPADCVVTEPQWATAPFHGIADSASGGAVRGYVANPAEFDQHGWQPVYAHCDRASGIIGYETPDTFIDSATYEARYGTPRVGLSAAPIPPALAAWITANAKPNGAGPATSADWVLTTRSQLASILGGADNPNDPVYLVDFHGDFVWEHSCPDGSNPSACTSRGTHAAYELDPSTLQVMAFGIESSIPNLASLSTFGPSGHVDLSDR
jgi:hypothetical protein